MSQYLMALGHDVALVDLDLIVPQPRSTSGVQAAQRDFGADGSVWEQGLFLPLEWTSLGTGSTRYQALLTQFGLDVALRAAVTVYAPDFEREWRRYNGWAIRPQTHNYTTFMKGVRILVNRLELSS